MPTTLHDTLRKMGIRSKLILLFVVIKVVPLVLLALLAWEGVSRLGSGVANQTDQLTVEVRDTVAGMGKTFSDQAQKALDHRAREELERLTTDTARAVADFLYDRDRDLLLAAKLDVSEDAFRRFLESRQRGLVDPGRWKLGDDGKQWVPDQAKTEGATTVVSSNPENQQDFHYRQPETVRRTVMRPLYHELTVIGLDGQEKIKVQSSQLLPSGLRDVSRRENTYCKAERYFEALKKLKPGEIYVSDVIGPYVKSRVIGPLTPDKARSLNIPFAPEDEAYAGRENPAGKRFLGIVRWATPLVKGQTVVGYLTLALDHTHIMSFTDNLMPTDRRYTPIPDAASGNYAFIWDYQDRSIAHPRHHSIVGFDPSTGEYMTPWLEAGLYDAWKQSGKPLRSFLAGIPAFDRQSRDKKPAKATTQAGTVGLECRYLNFAPQCQGWHDLTEHGGSGSFLILWTGVWKLTTAATIPYYTGQYRRTPRGFGYVTIGANIDDFHKPAIETADGMNAKVVEFGEKMKARQLEIRDLIAESMGTTAIGLTISTLVMVGIVVAIAIWLASMLTRRILIVIRGLQTIERGDFNFRFQKSGDDELGKLNESLNRMANAVQESFRRLEEARAEAEAASHLKSDFLARMSHELRTPLNGILGFAELISVDAPNEETREHANTILQSGQHLLVLLNDVLDLAKIEAGHMLLDESDFNLASLLQDAAALHRAAARQKGLSLETNLADDLPPTLYNDGRRLQQIINNLLSNAIKFTETGCITLSARIVDGQQIVIAVRDSGPGIEPEAQAFVFERFRQASQFINRKHGGTGLGLALVREFAQLMGGHVKLDSTPGEGSCFEVWLPTKRPN